MTASRISLISPTGALGMGFLDQSLERGISLKPDVIASAMQGQLIPVLFISVPELQKCHVVQY